MARFSNGWIKVYRSLGEGDLVQNPYLLALWVRLLTWATWKPSKTLWNGEQRDLPAGSVIFGYRELADQWNCSRATVHKWSHYLHDTDRITLETAPSGCLATIRNWELYQSSDDDERTSGERSANAERTLGEREVALIEEVKKEERRKKKNTPAFPFETFWEKYPRKIGKSDALSCFDRLILSQADFDSLIEAVTRFRSHHEGRGTEAQYIPHPATFLGTKEIPRWRDWLDEGNGKSDIRAVGEYRGIEAILAERGAQ